MLEHTLNRPERIVCRLNRPERKQRLLKRQLNRRLNRPERRLKRLLKRQLKRRKQLDCKKRKLLGA